MEERYVFIARNLLDSSNANFAYSGENGTIVSDLNGIKRLMKLAAEKHDLSKGFIADRIVGKAAALIMVLLGAKNVYARTLSKPAYEVFVKYGVNFTFTYLVEAIINRTGDDICPMEKTVLGTDEPKKAYELLTEKMKSLGENAN